METSTPNETEKVIATQAMQITELQLELEETAQKVKDVESFQNQIDLLKQSMNGFIKRNLFVMDEVNGEQSVQVPEALREVKDLTEAAVKSESQLVRALGKEVLRLRSKVTELEQKG